MKFSIRFADKIVGTLVIFALVIFIFVIFMIGSSQRWFVRDIPYKTYFNSASGLSRNMAIQHKGFTIGNVKNFVLTENDSVEVLFTIFQQYQNLVKEGSVVEIQISPIGLGNSFNFYPGRGAALIPEGEIIPEINSWHARQLMAQGLVDRQETSVDNVNVILSQTRTILESVNTAFTGSGEAENLPLGNILRNIELTSAELANITRSLSTQLNPIINNIEMVSRNISDPSGSVMSFFDNMESVSERISDPSGAVMAILDSDGPVYSDLTAALDSIAGIIDNLERTSDFIPSQLPQVAIMITDLNVALRTAQDVLTALSNNPLLRGGIPRRVETGPGGASPRDLEF